MAKREKLKVFCHQCKALHVEGEHTAKFQAQPKSAAKPNAPRPSKRAVSTKVEPSPEVGPQAEASLAGTGSGMPAGPEGHSAKGAAAAERVVRDRTVKAAPTAPKKTRARAQALIDAEAARKAAAKGAKPKRDRNEYQREYMRRKRAAKKAET